MLLVEQKIASFGNMGARNIVSFKPQQQGDVRSAPDTSYEKSTPTMRHVTQQDVDIDELSACLLHMRMEEQS